MRERDNFLEDTAKILAVDVDEQDKAQERADQLHVQADQLVKDSSLLSADTQDFIDTTDWDGLVESATVTDLNNLLEELEDTSKKSSQTLPHIDSISASDQWQELVFTSEEYADKYKLNLNDSYMTAMSKSEFAAFSEIMMNKYQISTLDKYDYIFSTIIGIIMGLVDAFLVGSITDGNNPDTKEAQGILGKNVDAAYDKLVKKFAVDKKIRQIKASKKMSATRQKDLCNQVKEWDIQHAIKFLEKTYRVSYDASSNNSVTSGFVEGMTPSNHHLLSLAHDPGLMGLVFGIVDQLSGKATMIDTSGKLVRVATKNKSSLNGASNTMKRVIDAVTNWFGHVMSDIAGSSTAAGRGAGLPMPFYSILQKMQFGHFNVNSRHQDMTLAQLSEWLYKQGLDTRAVTAQSIPVIVAEIIIRLYWGVKRHFYYGLSWKESLSTIKDADLSKMLTMGLATFESVDIADALLRSKVTPAALLRINYVGALDLGFRALQTMRNQCKHIHSINVEIDQDIQGEWDRILGE